ncbi:adenosine deaminase [Cohnella panacarvi]|uniref:adenosine deaminase n=1 Tax=Cohnella panacarvi TaxID=400776 RepID=UPI00047B7643|nr:adenosine deaminase [Cohnella panacarvi]
MDALQTLSALPKVDLHVHLDGSVSPESLIALARYQGIPLPTYDPPQLHPYMQIGEQGCGSLVEYLAKFDFVLPFLQTADALAYVATETVRQAAEHGAKYIEVRFAPQLHRERGLSADDAIRHVIRGLKLGERQFGVMARAIAICMRHHDGEANLEVVEAASRYCGHGLVAVDLAGNEAAYPASLFRDVFARAQGYGIPITIHAGEAAGPDNIAEAVERLGAARIGHGVRAREDDEVLALLRDRRIPLELCPTSNIQTRAVSGWSDYPIRDYVEQGLLLTVNTDNPSVSGTNLTNEYRVLAERFEFTPQEIKGFILNGVEAAFLREHEKEQLRREILEFGAL